MAPNLPPFNRSLGVKCLGENILTPTASHNWMYNTIMTSAVWSQNLWLGAITIQMELWYLPGLDRSSVPANGHAVKERRVQQGRRRSHMDVAAYYLSVAGLLPAFTYSFLTLNQHLLTNNCVLVLQEIIFESCSLCRLKGWAKVDGPK